MQQNGQLWTHLQQCFERIGLYVPLEVANRGSRTEAGQQMKKRGMMATAMRCQHIFCKGEGPTFDNGLAVELWEDRVVKECQSFCLDNCVSKLLSSTCYTRCSILCAVLDFVLLGWGLFSFLSVSFSEFYNVTPGMLLQRLQNLGETGRQLQDDQWDGKGEWFHLWVCSLCMCIYLCTHMYMCMHKYMGVMC